MIVEWLVGLGANISAWFASLFPDWTPPDFLVHLDTQVNGVLANLTGVGVWADWSYILVVVVGVLTVWVTAAIVKLARAVASYIPFFGGAG